MYENGSPRYDICEESHPLAEKKTFHDIKYQELVKMKLSTETVFETVRNMRSSVPESSLANIRFFTTSR